jgi:hypothetical protein
MVALTGITCNPLLPHSISIRICLDGRDFNHCLTIKDTVIKRKCIADSSMK